MRSVVVLPAPLGPRKPVTVPVPSSRVTLSTAVTAPKRLVSPFSSMAAMGLLLPIGSAVIAGLRTEGDRRRPIRRRAGDAFGATPRGG